MDPQQLQQAIEAAKAAQGMSGAQIVMYVLILISAASPHIQTLARKLNGKNGTSTAAGGVDHLSVTVMRVETKVDAVAADLAEVKADVAELKTKAAVDAEKLNNLKGRVRGIEERCNTEHRSS